MTLLLASAARATVGGRSGQEDAFLLWPGEGVVPPKAESGGLLAVLADGMGGHTGGAIAGQTACRTFTEVFSGSNAPPEARLKTALQASNEALAKGVEQNAALKGMGCTLVAAWIDDLGIRWTSVGDSLLLLYRLPDVIRLNADHSLGSFLDEQARQNKITRSEARRNRNRNALRSALTGSKIDLIDLRPEPLELRPGDWVLLASDGICSLPGDEIADVAYRMRQSTPEEMADALIAAVTQKGIVDQDNATVVAVRIDGAPATASDAETKRIAAKKGEEVDLRTRRIGVSRRGPATRRAGGRSRTVAVWLAAAAALVFCAVVLMLALPALRPPRPTNPASPGAQPASTKAGIPSPVTPVQPGPGKPNLEAPTTPPAGVPDKLPGGGDGQEGTAPSAPGKAAASPSPASEGEGRSVSRMAPARPAAVPPVLRSGAPPGEGDKPPRAGLMRPAAPLPPAARAPARAAARAPADTQSKSSGAAEPGSPRAGKEPARPKSEFAPGAFPGNPREELPQADPLVNSDK